jgi:alkylation response protein AidB-like acyl-CoA dehydrogenase
MASPTLPSRILSRRNLDFVLYEWLDATALTQRTRFSDHSRETFDAAIDLSERIATEAFYPVNKILDANEPTFDGERVHTPPELAGALKAFCDAGLMAASHGAEFGGMQLPMLLTQACMAWFHGASVSATGYALLTMGNANLQIAHAAPELVERWVRPMLTGRYFGTMCLSEPQAGSSLSDIRTRALPQADGSYRLQGSKMWISAGDHELTENILHLVLAKVPDADGKLPPGTRGISLFLVPKHLPADAMAPAERNDVTLAGLNHKMGFRGVTNCLLNFGEGLHRPRGSAGAVGWLVGKPGEGLRCMFHMMNEARVGVGLGAVMLGYTGYLHALDYARNRPQGRLPNGKSPTAPQVAIVEHADVRRMLLAQKSYVEGGLALVLYCARLLDEAHTAPGGVEQADAQALLELLTPIAKSWPSQWCLVANDLAIQVHGGYGYTRDYNVEQYYRDNRLNPIHEGAHGIQALDLLGRKVRQDGGRGLVLLRQRMQMACERAHASEGAHAPELAEWGETLVRRLGAVERTIGQLHGLIDLDLTLANASMFLEAFGHIVVSWIWLEQALVAHAAAPGSSDEDGDFYAGKHQAARFFFRWELPKVDAMVALLDSADDTTLRMHDDWF